MKRHTRPYACVWPECWKRFGSKNDWIRHERGQHFQDKFWLCHCPDDSARFGRCSKHFRRLEAFEAHLRREHDLQEHEWKDTIDESTIGFQGQPRFWCGFCKKNCWRGLSLVTKFDGKNPLDDRFNHINEHFQEGKQAEEWVHWETLQTKREMAETQAQNEKNGSTRQQARSVGVPNVVITDENTVPNKKRKSFEGRSPEKEDANWFCCQCNAGPLNPKLHGDCGSFSPDCNHRICSQCPFTRGSKVVKLHGEDYGEDDMQSDER